MGTRFFPHVVCAVLLYVACLCVGFFGFAIDLTLPWDSWWDMTFTYAFTCWWVTLVFLALWKGITWVWTLWDRVLGVWDRRRCGD
jgi:hypothetical protein